jgi:hypothetical protein
MIGQMAASGFDTLASHFPAPRCVAARQELIAELAELGA